MYRVKPGRACGKGEGGVRDARLPKLMLLPAITDGNEPGEPDARKPARPVRERVVGNVSTSRVRERRVSFQSLSPALLETRQRASYLVHETAMLQHFGDSVPWLNGLGSPSGIETMHVG